MRASSCMVYRPNLKWLIPLGGLLLLAALWAGMLAHLRREEAALMEATHERARLLVDALVQHVRTSIHDIDVVARVVKREFERDPDAFDLRQLRGSGLLSPLSAAQVSVVDSDGQIVQSSIPYEGGVQVGDRAHFQVHVKPDVHGLHIGKPVLGRVSGIWTIQLTRRLEDRGGRFAGIVVVSEDRQHLIDPFLKAARLHPADVAIVSLKDGAVLSDSTLRPARMEQGDASSTYPESSPISRKDTSQQGLGQEDVALEPVPGRMPASSPAQISARREVPDYPLVVEVRLDRVAALASLHQARTVYLLLAGLMSLALLIFFAAIHILIRRLSSSEARLRTLSETDSLTGLANRHGLLARLAECLNRQEAGSRLALIYIDLGNLKQVNDELGHEAGDQLLKMFGQRLQQNLPEHVWSRFGGDEFVGLVPLADPSIPVETGLAGIRSSVLDILRSPVNLRGHVFQMKAAVGVAVHEAGSGVASLMREANEAMRDAKAEMRQTGESVWRMHTAAMRQANVQAIEMEQSLRAGILPCVSWVPLCLLQDGGRWGGRAQFHWPVSGGLRQLWGHQPRFMATPDSGLLPLMLSGLLQVLDTHVDEAAPNGRVCLPLSVAQCLDPDCVALIEGWCADTGFSLERLYFECPASLLEADSAKVQRHLKRLHGTGAGLLIGDFMGGLSALSWLETGLFAGVSVSGREQGLARRALGQLAADGFLVLAGEGCETDKA
ncbi:MAG: diguanylate cyclase [Lautropia sp.]|nr:diguanylate cyclase [Lautropia sp.]